MKARRFTVMALLVLTVWAGKIWGTTPFDPRLRWQTLETPNFSVHYHEGEEGLAQEVGRIAEDVHREISPYMRWKPFAKTQVVLSDNVDFANGMATPFPVNTIVLFAAPPAGAELDVCEDWFRELITHEYTHILHLDQVGGIWQILRYVFGRCVLPNAIQPIWLIEGFGVHNESKYTAGGRDRGATFDMMLRVATLEGRLNSLDQAGTFIPSWPAGSTPYLYGGMFYKWLAEEYGEEKLVEVSRLYSALIPFLVDLPAVVVYGKPWYVLWGEWVNHLREKYEKERKEIESKPLTSSTPLTCRGYYIESPSFSPDGQRIAYVEYNGDEYPSLRLSELDQPAVGCERGGLENHIPVVRSLWLRKTEDPVLLRGPINPGVSFSPRGDGLVLSQRETYDNFYTYDDLYLLDLKTRKKTRLTRGLRARDPDFSPDGDRIVFVVNRLGKNELALISRDGSDLRHLTQSEEHIQYSLPRFSPDGRWVAVSRWSEGGYQDICLIDMAEAEQNGEVEPLPIFEDRAVDLSPFFTPDGEWVLFSSDRSGVYNIYAYSPGEHKLYQATNVLGGAFSPIPSPDGKRMAFLSYGANGYDIHMTDYDPTQWWEASPYVDRLPEALPEVSPVEYRTHSYNPIPSLLPRFWLPIPTSDEKGVGVGFVTFGWDVLEQHQYFLSASWGIETERAAFQFSYLNNASWPEIGVDLSDGAASMRIERETPVGVDTACTYWERRQKGELEVALPFQRTSSGYTIGVNYVIERLSSLIGLPPAWPRPDTGLLSGIGLFLRYGNAKEYAFGVSPTDGRYVSFGIERSDRRLNSDFNITKFSFDWREYLEVPILKHHVLAGRLAGAMATGETLVQRSFHLGLGDELLLRGYPEGEFSGQKALSLNLEHRFPLLWANRGVLTLPLFLRNLEGDLFLDLGNAWDSNQFLQFRDWKVGVGGELGAKFDPGWLLSLLLKIGWAQGLSEEGESQLYLSLGSSF